MSFLQTQLNNFFNTTIDLLLNEVIYNFKTREMLAIVANEIIQMLKNIFNQRLKYQREAVDVTIFVNVKIKVYYNAKHQAIFFRFNKKIYFWLHHNYKLLDRFNRKMFNQRCEFFTIKRRVKRLVYELNLFVHWRIYSVISIAQLKSCFNKKNFYYCSRFNYLKAVKVKSDIKNWKSYIVKRIVDKRLRKFDWIIVIQYLIKWNGYGFKYNE